MNARTAGWAAYFVLVALQPLWHLFWLPPSTLPAWAVAAFFLLPPLLPLVALGLRRPSALFWAAVISLFYFCHGVMEGWSDPAARLLAAFEIAASTAIVLAVGWDGLQRRRAARASYNHDIVRESPP